MKHEHISSPVPHLVPPDIAGDPAVLAFAGRDATTGLSDVKAAEAAARNVLQSGFSDEEIIDLAVNFVESQGAGKTPKLGKAIKDLASRRELELLDTSTYQPSKALKPATLVHSTYIVGLLSPGGYTSVADSLSQELLGVYALDHAQDLAQLRGSFPELHESIIDGKFENALRAGHPLLDRQRLAVVVARHMKCFAVRTAHARMELVHQVATEPYGSGFAGLARFKFCGPVILSTIAAPAGVLQRLANADGNGVFNAVTEINLEAGLVKAKIIPASMGAALIEQAKAAAHRLKVDARAGIDIQVRNALAVAARAAGPASMLNLGMMKQEGLDQRSFVEHLLGLTPAEAASFVADELLRACKEIDLFVSRFVGTPIIANTSNDAPNLKPAGFVANLLRAEAQCERYAPSLHVRGRGSEKEFDRTHFPGRDQLKSMRAKLATDGRLERRVKKRLGIDARAWFK